MAEMLDSTVESANSALKWARGNLRRRTAPATALQRPTTADSRSEDAIVGKFVNAWESADLDEPATVLTDDFFTSMPGSDGPRDR
jgi:hypothetical protein